MRKKFDHSAKTIVVGDSGVGKTCVLLRFARNMFHDDTPSTLGVEFLSTIVERPKRKIELQLWDTAGQEIFRSVTRGYFHGSVAVFVIYDITSRETFEHVREWISDVHETVETDIISVLIGNKCDLADRRQVSYDAGKTLAEELNMQFFETSAKLGENVAEAMNACVDGIETLIDDGRFNGDFYGDLNAKIQARNIGNSGDKGKCC